MYRDGIDLPKEEFNIIFNQGGLGDGICRLTAVKYLRDTQQHLNLHVWVPDYFLDLAKNLVPGIDIQPFSNKDKFKTGIAGRQTDNDNHTLMASHLIDQAFHTLVDQQVDIQYKNYCQLNLNPISIKKFNLPKKYVIVTTGFTSEVREMLPKTTNEIVDYIISKGYEVVFLGSKVAYTGIDEIGNIEGSFSKQIDYTKGINLIDKTTLLEAGKVIANAKAIIGLDNGLIHLAGTTDTAIVAGFTTVNPDHRAPIRKNQYGYNFYPVVPPENLKCRFCQSNWAHVYNHSFKTCFYKEKKLDKEIQCTKQLTSDLYIKELEKII